MADAATLTLRDVAWLAHVQRPVVSMWRRRTRARGEEVRFPDPVAVEGGAERFDRDEVVAWIARTGRGNNPEFAVDAAAGAVPEGATDEQVAALLWLRTVADADLTGRDSDGLVELADSWDPDDECALTEVEQLGPTAVGVVEYVDALYDLSYSAADALDRLARTGRWSRSYAPGLAPQATALLQTLVRAVAREGDQRAVVADGSGGRSSLFLELAAGLADTDGLGVLLGDASQHSRAVLRTATLRGIPVHPPGDPAIRVSSVVGLDARQAVTELDELQLALPAHDVALVLGPAGVLTDALEDGEAERDRDAIVRTGTLRLAARLPRGLDPAAPRQMLALWVLASGQTERPIERRALAQADLSARELSADVCEDLATDAVAVLGEFTKHAYRFGRVVPTSRVIAARVLVPTAVRAPALVGPSSAEQLLRVERAQQDATAVLEPLTWAAVPGEGDAAGEAALGLLVEAGRVRLLGGSRLDRAGVHPGGAVRVLDPEKGEEREGYDRLDLELRHPRARRTEPGDVVFHAAPEPAATVDTDGGHLVATPARVLRVVDDERISPRAIAVSISRQTGGDWRTWRVSLTPSAQVARLDAALAETHGLRGQLQDRLRAVTDLEDALIAGASTGAVALTTDPATTDSDEEGR